MILRPFESVPRGAFRSGRWAASAFVAVFLAACGGADTEGEPDPATSEPAEATGQQASEPVDLRQVGIDIGDTANVAVGIVEFSDFGCGHCADFHTNTYPAIEDEFVDSGDVFFKYIPITLGGFPNGDLAGIAGVCAHQQSVFAQVRDQLFEDREAWLTADEDGAQERFVAYAETAGADAGDFEACLGSDAAAAEIAGNNEVAQTIGIRVTPTFLIGGRGIQGAPSLPEFQEALRDMVEQARAALEDPAASGPPQAP